MKKLLYLIVLMAFTYIGYWVGTQTWILDQDNKLHHFNTEEARLSEVKYCNSLFEGLHWYYQRDTALWNNTFSKTHEFKEINTINEGDWEDFFLEWDKHFQ